MEKPCVEEAVKACNENEDVTNDSVNENVNITKLNADVTTGIVLTNELELIQIIRERNTFLRRNFLKFKQ